VGKAKEHLAGRNELPGLCPFHDDSNPSFGYNYEKDQYHCFTCGADSDLIELWSHVRGTGNEADDFNAFCREHGLQLTGSGKQGGLRALPLRGFLAIFLQDLLIHRIIIIIIPKINQVMNQIEDAIIYSLFHADDIITALIPFCDPFSLKRPKLGDGGFRIRS
jgi:hypothetical protein